MNKLTTILLGFTLCLLVACSGNSGTSDDRMTTYTIGLVNPLTGDGAVYGLPMDRMIQVAVDDLNEEWAAKNMHLNVIREDGKCSPGPALGGAQKLVNFDGVKVIYGMVCSGEVLGIAPFAEENEVLVFGQGSSPVITEAGDFVFRNYPSDVAQVQRMSQYILKTGYQRIAIISENTDYAQALRRGYVDFIDTDENIELVADEVIASTVRDIRTEVAKVTAANPDVIILLPQTIPVGVIYIQQLYQAGNTVPILGNEVMGFQEVLDQAPTELEGIIYAESYFSKADDSAVQQLLAEGECELGVLCASAYDGILLLGEKLEVCGEDPVCIRDELYATQNWEGTLSAPMSFDENGDIGGDFVLKTISNGEFIFLE